MKSTFLLPLLLAYAATAALGQRPPPPPPPPMSQPGVIGGGGGYSVPGVVDQRVYGIPQMNQGQPPPPQPGQPPPPPPGQPPPPQYQQQPQAYQPPPPQYQTYQPPPQARYQETRQARPDPYAEREAIRRAEMERAEARRQAELRVQPLPVEEPERRPEYQPATAPARTAVRRRTPQEGIPGSFTRALLDSEVEAITPPRGAGTSQAPAPATSSGGGMPDWALPALLILATPIILMMMRDDEPKLRGGVATARDQLEADADALAKASERMRAGDFESAVPSLQSIVRGGGAASTRARLLIAHCWIKTGLSDVAVEELRTLDVADQPVELIYDVARAASEAGHDAAARPLFLSILRRDVAYRDVAARVKGATGASPLASGASLRAEVSAHGTPVIRAQPSGTPTPVLTPDTGDELPTGTEGTLPARFVDIKFLARGGMGVVYEARDRDLERRVAIKMLSPAYCSDADFVERFFRESRAIARLTHPCIVSVFDVARTPVPYMVMEFLDGKSLRRVLAEGTLTYRQRITVGLNIATGLAYAHGQGVIHRDVKPENVIVTADGRAKLVDFGLARFANPDGAPSGPQLTQPNVVMGTPSYMAPELYVGVPANERTDGYALGRVLRELIVAEGPDSETASVGIALSEMVERLASPDFTKRPKSLLEPLGVLQAELNSMTLAPETVS